MIFFSHPSDEYGFLCNDDIQAFTVGKMAFSSISKYMSYCKAQLFGDNMTARRIYAEWNLWKIKGYDTNVKGYDEIIWNGQCGPILYRGLKAKFDQNPVLITQLVQTGTEILVYLSSQDHVLGIGLSEFDQERYDKTQWKGQNLLGFALMDLRTYYQSAMPDGIKRKLQGKLAKNSPPDFVSALNGGAFSGDRSAECKCPPYEGNDPYIYLNYSLRDLKIAYKTVEVLNKLGFNVWYDKFLYDGRLWSAERSDAIERCTLLIDIENGEKYVSHVRLFGTEFAEKLGIPIVQAYMDDTYRKKKEDVPAEQKAEPLEGEEAEPSDEEEADPTLIDASVYDADFIKKCLKTLELNNIFPRTPEVEATPEVKATPEVEASPEVAWHSEFDLAFRFYKDYGGDRGWFKHTNWYWCNLRTREVFYSDGSRATTPSQPVIRQDRYVDLGPEPLYLSEEEVYRASVWKSKGLMLADKSEEPDYIGTPEDWAFSALLAQLGGGPVEKIVQEYKELRKKLDKAESDYPYMDEFEYISSDPDEDD